MQRVLALSICFLFMACGDDGSPSDSDETGTASSGPTSSTSASSSASTSSTTTNDTSTGEPGTTTMAESGSTTMPAESSGSSSSGSSEVECMWYDEPSGERSWGRCTPWMAWQDAEDACVAEGGHLVSVRTAMDGIFANNVLAGVEEAWIGLNDIATAETYEWTDGTMYEYMNWDDTQPDSDDDRCVWIGVSRRWFDSPCDSERPFVCARDL